MRGRGPLRAALVLAGLACAIGTAAPAQQPSRVPRVGILTPTSPSYEWTQAARSWLGELGYVEGRNVAIEMRSAAGRDDRLPALAAELVRRDVDVILTAGTRGIEAARRATATIPIVMAADRDPVAAGFVASLARPGGNVTGIALLVPELGGKRIELLREAVPRLGRVGVLWNPADPDREDEWKATRAAGRTLGVDVVSLEVRNREALETAVRAAARRRAGGLVVLADSMTWANARLIAELAARHRLPAMYSQRWFVETYGGDGLMSYGPSQVDLSRRLAAYVDRILKGARPAEMPVEQPSRYELVVNRRAAGAIGLVIPQSFLVRVDRVVE